MSTAGRLQEAFWDILHGHDNGDGSHTPGPLAGLPLDEFSDIIDRLVDAALSIVGG